MRDGIEEIAIYSTNPEGDVQALVSRLQNIFETWGLKDKVRVEPAPTNYTSIHIVVWCRGKYRQEYRNVPVEIQIRTALEDVWGEIDHSLKYTTKKTEDHPWRDERRVENNSPT